MKPRPLTAWERLGWWVVAILVYGVGGSLLLVVLGFMLVMSFSILFSLAGAE